MSMYNSLGISVEGIRAHSHAMGNVSNDLANASTDGFKGKKTGFEWIVIGGEYNGGTKAYDIQTLNLQGPVKQSDISTHIAIEGDGMLVVSQSPNENDNFLFTRSGSFAEDKNGNLINNDGMFLKAWALNDTQNENQEVTLGQLETVNLKGIGVSAIPTTQVLMNMNLNADENIQKGMKQELHIKNEEGKKLELDELILPDQMSAGDSIKISLSNGTTHDFTYGGVHSSSQMQDFGFNTILGANQISQDFAALKDGDAFTIHTPSSGTVAFQYSKHSPSTGLGYFNTLNNLASAIDASPGLISKVSNGQLYISAQHASEKITFSNSHSTENMGKSNDISNVFGKDTPKSEVYSVITGVTTPLYGSGSANEKFTTGIGYGDGIAISLTNGEKHIFTYNETPKDGANEFNSLASLSKSISSINSLNSNILNDNQLRIGAVKNHIMSIENINNSNTADKLGINIDSSFKEGIKEGDSMKISIGSYDNLSSKLSINSSDNLNKISQIRSEDLIKNENFNIYRTSDIFENVENNDGIQINIDGEKEPLNLQYVKYSPNTSIGQFNSLETLNKAINQSTSVTSKIIESRKIEISTSNNSKFIKSISSYGEGKSQIAEKLGIALNQPPKKGDTLDLALDNGRQHVFMFTGDNVPRSHMGEFNSINGLIEAINEITLGSLDSSIKNENFNIQPGIKSPTSIKSASGNIAEYLGMNVFSEEMEFRYVANNPNTTIGEFNDILTLNSSLNEKSGLKSSISESGKEMHIKTNNGANFKFISDINNTGNSNIATELGFRQSDIVKSIGLYTDNSVSENSFANTRELARLINASEGVSAEIKNESSIEVFADSIAENIQFTNANHNSGKNNLLKTLGLGDNSIISPRYSPEDSTKNISSNSIEPNFSHNLLIYDSLGSSHNLQSGFIKLDQNQWVMEIYALNKDEIITDRNDGLLGFAELEFNGDGTLHKNNFISLSRSNESPTDIKINWKNGAESSKIAFDLGETDPRNQISDFAYTQGLRQFSAEYNIDSFEQNGTPVGNVRRIDIDKDGFIVANFSNGTSRQFYKIPIAEFPNMNGLKAETSNAYSQTSESGDFILQGPGQGQVGKIRPAALEQSNTDVYSALFKMIEYKHKMQSNIKALNTSDKMLEEISRQTA